jgi:hypothetical protein
MGRMSEFEEYEWIQRSVDMTLSEVEEAKALSEKLKEAGKIQRRYYYFPEEMVRNPSDRFYFELESGKDLYILEYSVSEN